MISEAPNHQIDVEDQMSERQCRGVLPRESSHAIGKSQILEGMPRIECTLSTNFDAVSLTHSIKNHHFRRYDIGVATPSSYFAAMPRDKDVTAIGKSSPIYQRVRKI